MIKSCIDCGDTFSADEDWKIRCIPCWRRSKRGEEGGGYWKKPDPPDRWRLQAKLGAAQTELAKARERITELEQHAHTELDPAMLRTLVHLCHPDKHGGSRASERAASYLNQLRSKHKCSEAK